MRQLPQQTRPSDCSVGDSQKGPCGNSSGIHETPAASARDTLLKPDHEYLSIKAEQTLPPALRKHAAYLSTGGNSRDVTQPSPPVPNHSAADTSRAENEVHEHCQNLESMQSTLAAGLPKLGPQTIN